VQNLIVALLRQKGAGRLNCLVVVKVNERLTSSRKKVSNTF
jgi:hypothetical protein